MDKLAHAFRYIQKSKFVRSIFLQVLAIFIGFSIAIIAIVFFSFASEINKSIIEDRQKQLAVIEGTISKRMDEISSIAYNIGDDRSFYLEPVAGDKYSGYEMSNTLERYLVGNSFIEHLAYYRLSEPDKLYTSRGELSFSDFWTGYLHLDKATAGGIIHHIQNATSVEINAFSFGKDKTYFAYLCPLPQFSAKPQAFVLMMIPSTEVRPLLEAQLTNSYGKIAVFDATGKEIYSMSTGGEDLPITLTAHDNGGKAEYQRVDGRKFVIQTQVSAENGWTYVSAIRLNDIIAGLANQQLLFIALLFVLMLAAVFAMLVGVVVQYRPISNLAAAVTDEADEPGGKRSLIDENDLLSSTFAALKDDSEQKQHFEAAYYEAEAASKAKSAFLSNMSHDIRTPMNAIVGMSAIAYKHADDPVYVRECIGKVQMASQYLLDIINNVLDMSRIESGRFTLSEDVIELPKLVYGLMTILNQSVEAKRQRFIVETENIVHERVLGDNVRLTQVFVNILSNSVKFTPEGGVIRLHMREEPAPDAAHGQYVFAFTDTGIGMAPEFVGKVFDTFTRGSDADAAKVEGTGLGMAIAKNLVELMGGTIVCESTRGVGTTFTVTLPLKLAEDGMAETDAGLQDAPVLIAGGDEAICSGLVRTFTELGARTAYAATAEQAGKMAAQAFAAGQPYRLAVVHPEADGSIEAAAAITAAAPDADTLCVLAVKNLADISRAQAEDAGVRAVVQAPLFKSAVRRLMNGTPDTPDAEESTDSGVPDFTGRRVLVAEDNTINREIARKVIGETGAEVVETENGKEALDAFAAHPAGYFDIILMDIQMPVMNGYEAAANIRALQQPDAQDVPIYALTASTFDEDVRLVRAAGMNGHLGKPYTPTALYQVLAQSFR